MGAGARGGASENSTPPGFFVKARGVLTQSRRAALDLLYPPRCLGCAVPARGEALGDEAPLCPACLRALPRASADRLRRTLGPAPPSFGEPFALWQFDEGVVARRVQHALKYGNRPRLGRTLGHLLGRAHAEAGHAPPLAVVPVPLARLRRIERGYNQSALLAQGFAEAAGVPFRPDLLRRTRPTRRQAKLSREARRANVAGAFALTGTPPASVLLIDDVLTTGATLRAAALPLWEAGTAVSLAVLASTAL